MKHININELINRSINDVYQLVTSDFVRLAIQRQKLLPPKEKIVKNSCTVTVRQNTSMEQQ